ncbi:MAG TPA: valine--tRNA ligase [Steroidobacteraceae bacterium]|nr:valine--tRNA ligase [Steroidobacteraceae bacterium]
MEKAYSPRDIEQRNYQRWEAAGWFKPSGKGMSYCIVIPPPNVTGTLHMGHAFQHSLMDTLTRLHRMDGDNALWQPGTDHAGIATQMVVERQLNAEGKHRHDLGREEFLKRVWQWKEQSGDTICRQMRRLGNSVDWEHDRFTMDEGLSKAVTEVFVRLYEENLIYRGKRLVNWDPVLHTALSDLEVQSEPEQGHLWHFKYPLADGSGHLVVATTRPETMLGDTAVAVHPEDERYKHLVGKQIKLPLTDRLIPIIADDYVDREFGSGCVKITPAHDFNDYEMGKRHGLELINIFDANATINDQAPTQYQGLDRFKARKQIVSDLEALGLVEKIEPHTLNVPRGDRSNAVLEPWLTDQWYVRVAPLAEPAIKVVEDGRVKFVPDNWSKTYFQWMHNIQDWCISRQLWWGHRIPAWYDDQGNIYVARNEAEAQQQAMKQHGKQVSLQQDNDVLDTWFSSALWPFSTLGWPEQTDRLKTFYPTNVLVTGFDIIFFWVARMIMMGLKFAGDVPFREVYITGLVRDENGDKMSKSKGNIIDPLDLIDGIDLESLVAKRTTGLMQPQLKDKIEKNTRKQFPQGIPSYGADALRFTLASLATQGRDIRFELGRIEGYRNFCNKLWNAARYVLMNTDGQDCSAGGELSIADRWIKSRLGHTIEQVRNQFNHYRFDLASQALYEFAWYEYCDWYLELSKPVLQSESSSAAQKRGTRHTLLQVFEGYLRLLHPLMPFVTEEIWQSIAPLAGVKIDPSRNTIMLQAYPKISEFPVDADADQAIAPIKAAILGPRQIRGQLDVPQSRKITLYFKSGNAHDWPAIENNLALVMGTANVSAVIHVSDESSLPPAALQVVDGRSLYAPLSELIDDVDAELNRIEKRKARTTQELAKCENKLSNANFVANAPAAVVEQERERIVNFKAELQQLTEQAQRVALLRK